MHINIANFLQLPSGTLNFHFAFFPFAHCWIANEVREWRWKSAGKCVRSINVINNVIMQIRDWRTPPHEGSRNASCVSQRHGFVARSHFPRFQLNLADEDECNDATDIPFSSPRLALIAKVLRFALNSGERRLRVRLTLTCSEVHEITFSQTCASVERFHGVMWSHCRYPWMKFP